MRKVSTLLRDPVTIYNNYCVLAHPSEEANAYPTRELPLFTDCLEGKFSKTNSP